MNLLRARAWVRAVVPLGLVVCSTCAALLIAEAALRLAGPSSPRFVWERGMYLGDSQLGVVLKPGFATHFDDGIARGEIRINTLGQRDEEPGGDAERRILLVGDSFAFGALLDQRETIDRAMERLVPGLDVYNLGVSGYNLPDQLEALRRCALPAKLVLYLFFENDLQPADPQAVVDGYRVMRFVRPDGRQASDEELGDIIQTALASRREGLSAFARLTLVRQLVRRGRQQPVDDQTDLIPAADRPRLVARALRYSLAMRDEAARRGMSFAVAIVPAVGEVRVQQYQPSTSAYVAGLRQAGFTPIDMLKSVVVSDYWTHNAHFNASGARAAARAILGALPMPWRIHHD